MICDKGAERALFLSEGHYTIRHLDRISSFVISTERSEWRDLINALLAQAASRRDISTTLEMTGGGDLSTTLEMTGGGYARYDKGEYARHDKGIRSRMKSEDFGE